MYNILQRKKDILPEKKKDADTIMQTCITTKTFQDRNERFRRELIIKQKLGNLVKERDRLHSYIDGNITTALKDELRGRIFNMSNKIDAKLFQLHILGRPENNI